MSQTSPVQVSLLTHEHLVQFYEDDAFLVDEVTEFIGAGLQAGESGIVIATPAHRSDLAQRLQAIDGSWHPGQYIALDAAETLSKFMVDGWPDERRFTGLMEDVLRRAAHNGTRQVRAFGEMVALLWADGKHDAALRLEELWNDLARTHSFSLLCAYPMQGFDDEEHGHSFLHICKAHSQVRPAESFAGTAAPDELQRQVALLQQKAAALEGEVARRRRVEQALRERERELSDFLENAVEGLHKVGADGTILWANQAELDILGYPPEEYIGRHIAEFHADREAIQQILETLQRGEAFHDCPATLRCRDGSIKHVRISSNALIENGEFIHTRCFTRDVTDRVRLETELHQRLTELAETDRRKDEFLAMLGHELRNPLAAIVNAAELMRLSNYGPTHMPRAREIVARQSARMARLVDDLLDIARINQGKIEIRATAVQLGPIIEQAVELVRQLVDERGHRLTVDLPAGPVTLSGDPTRLVQVIGNLLHNAAKYTEPGGHISLSAREEGTDLLLSVRDDGVGLTPELRARIFEPFVQAPGSLEQAQGGLGIGLTLVRSLVELHGGGIVALSDGPGCGSEFVVRLPLLQAVALESAEATLDSAVPA
jgi:PAS domain S-box-containing protein